MTGLSRASASVRDRTSIAELLFVLGLLLFPYDAMHVMPSTYRPIALIPFALSLLFCVADVSGRRVLRKRQWMLLAFFVAAIMLTVSITLVEKGDFEAFEDSSLTLVVGVVSFFSFSLFLGRKVHEVGFDSMLSWLFGHLSLAYVIPLVVGCLEALSLMGVLPASVDAALIAFFGGNQPQRLTITSYEASWASVHMIIAAVSYYYVYRKNKRLGGLLGLAASIALFLYTKSMQGVMIIAVASLVYAVWFSYAKGNFLLLVKWVAAIALCLATVIGLFIVVFSIQGDSSYYAVRLLNFTNVENLIYADGSSFVRLVFPVIGMQMFFAHPLFGVGGGGFASDLPGYIYTYYPWALNFAEIVWDLDGTLTPSATCLYTRVFAEFGLVGAIPFFALVASSFANMGKVACRGGTLGFVAAFFVVALLCAQLQFSSFAYLPFWLALGILDSVSVDSGLSLSKERGFA